MKNIALSNVFHVSICLNIFICFLFLVSYVLIRNQYPQNKRVSAFCPSGTTYARHVCGSGADGWEGSGRVSYGPYSGNDYLGYGGHCSCCCNCHEIKVECISA